MKESYELARFRENKTQRLSVHTKADGHTKTHHYENPLRDELSRITYTGGEPQRSYTYTTYGQPLTAANANSTITYGYGYGYGVVFPRKLLLGSVLSD